jgi:hypothetical protein
VQQQLLRSYFALHRREYSRYGNKDALTKLARGLTEEDKQTIQKLIELHKLNEEAEKTKQ